MIAHSIRAVLFDVDDTLVDHEAAQRAGIQAQLGLSGEPLDESVHRRWKAHVDASFARYLAGELSFVDQRRERARAMTGQAMTDAEADEWIAGTVQGFEAGLRAFDDVLPTLTRLAEAGVRLGAFSNVNGDFTRRKLGLVGLADRFDVVLGDDDVGAAKPAPEPFLALCVALGVEPAEAVHVGDRWLADVVGARAAGLTGVWLSRPGLDPTGRVPDAAHPADPSVPVISTLAELPALLPLTPHPHPR